MAKKHKRFGALHKTLKDTNYSATSGAAGEYLNFLKGTNKLVVARKPDAKFLIRFNVGVIPFDIEPSSASGAINAYQGTMTVVADNIRGLFNTTLTDGLLGIERDLTKTKQITNFYPALAHITVIPTAATKTQKTSGITKRSYKAYPSRSGGVPYGRTTTSVKDESGATITDIAKETEEDSRKAIMIAVKGKEVTGFKCIGVSFTPELHPEDGFFDVAKPTTPATGLPTG
ncbi:hypothetical protein [uncultured Nostoc sp.]|uniref:hypothetical protein n=1 Tax=uncultured Nostoc sp. TaxID=340711 RepID=UPI0035CA1BCF